MEETNLFAVIINMPKTKKTLTLVAFLLIFTCLCIGCCWTLLFPIYGINGPTAQQGQDQAIDLLIALEQYKTDTGKYPSNLELLVPAYLPHIPQPAPRWRYEYKLQAGNEEFFISFDVGRNMDGDYCEYDSKIRLWMCSDKI